MVLDITVWSGDTRAEEKLITKPAIAIVAKQQPLQTWDHDRISLGILKFSQGLASCYVEGVDGSVAEIPDQ